MIVSFKHKGLEKLFTENKTKGIKQDQIKRLKLRLLVLNNLENIEHLKDNPGFKLHKLTGELKNHYSI